MHNILIIHSHNANRGDEAAVKALVDELLEFKNINKITISNNGFTPYPGLDSQVNQIARFPKLHSTIAKIEFLISLVFKDKLIFTKDGKKFFKELRNSDLVIHAPGGPSIGDTYYNVELLYLLRLDIIRRMRIPYMFYSPSMGPFNDKRREKLRKKILRGAHYVFVRDPISYKYVKEFTPEINVQLAMDSALQHDLNISKYEMIYDQYTELKSFMTNHTRCIGMTITDLKWHPIHGKTKISSQINDVFQKFVDQVISEGYGVVFIPQLYGTSNDARYMAEFMRTNHTFLIDDKEEKFDSYFQQYVISLLYAVVGMRYHSNIFSAKMGTPFISVSYEQKMKGFMESTDLLNYCININDLSYDILFSKYDELKRNYISYKNRLKDLHKTMKEKAFIPTQAIIDYLQSIE